MRGQFLYNVLGSHAWPISRTYQIVAHWCNSWVTVASLVGRRISTKMLWSYNVLGSHAWPISRTYQIVAHWCNSWVTVASLVDRRISMITARSCTSRQMDPIQRKPFVDIHFFCVLSCVMWRPDLRRCHNFKGKDWTRQNERLEKSRSNQFVKVVCHCHVNVGCVSEQPGDNVLGSHACRISRTYQIVAHWCNSWVPVASLIDRRIHACVPVCLRI